MLLNAFAVDPGAAQRTLELQAGELYDLGLRADLLVVSAFEGNYAPEAGTLIAGLQRQFGIQVDQLPRPLDFTHSSIGAWVSSPLEQLLPPPCWPDGIATRFNRIAVVESPNDADAAAKLPWPVFRQLFSLLAVLPLQGIDCSVVATPLVGAGNQGILPERLFPELLARCRSGFRHVPDLERFIIFDRRRAPLEQLSKRIDLELGRSPADRDLVPLGELNSVRSGLIGLRRGLERLDPSLGNGDDLGSCQER